IFAGQEDSQFIQIQNLRKDIEDQAGNFLREINELQKDLETKDNLCHQLEDQIIIVGESPEFIQMRAQLLDDLKSQEERHLQQTTEFSKQLEAKDKICLEAAQLRERLNLCESCPICMEAWTTDNHRMAALACGHIFGESCLRQSLQRNPLCPECRANASENDIRRLFPR
ncbi:hypothetical protein KR093_007163, partial [Drosophila rubida]